MKEREHHQCRFLFIARWRTFDWILNKWDPTISEKKVLPQLKQDFASFMKQVYVRDDAKSQRGDYFPNRAFTLALTVPGSLR